MARQAWRRIGRQNGSDIGRMAIKVYRCNGCGIHHKGAKPAQCMGCGRMDFTKFDSVGEANRYARLLLRQHAGLISGLEAHVPFPLMTIGRNGLPCKFATYEADFVYVEDGVRVIEDWKSSGGIDPSAALKLRVMEAMGNPVKLVTDKGEV
jgi:hypothetical protein